MSCRRSSCAESSRTFQKRCQCEGRGNSWNKSSCDQWFWNIVIGGCFDLQDLSFTIRLLVLAKASIKE